MYAWFLTKPLNPNCPGLVNALHTLRVDPEVGRECFPNASRVTCNWVDIYTMSETLCGWISSKIYLLREIQIFHITKGARTSKSNTKIATNFDVFSRPTRQQRIGTWWTSQTVQRSVAQRQKNKQWKMDSSSVIHNEQVGGTLIPQWKRIILTNRKLWKKNSI